MLQFGTSLTDDTMSVNYDHIMFIIQTTDYNYDVMEEIFSDQQGNFFNLQSQNSFCSMTKKLS